MIEHIGIIILIVCVLITFLGDQDSVITGVCCFISMFLVICLCIENWNYIFNYINKIVESLKF